VTVKKDASSEGLDEYEALSVALAARGSAQPGRMMGMPALKAGGRMFAGYFDGSMTFKLPEPTRAEALSIPGAKLFDPSGMGRPMREWVQVPAAASARWAELAEAALATVGG
jgi:hypothetical protein